MQAHKILSEMFSQGKISRREFLARASALGLTAALSPAILNTRAFASVPKKGGRLRIGMADCHVTDSLDPMFANAMGNITISYTINNCLFELDDKNNLVPELAESYEVSSDATKWHLKLRKGVEFHNGKTLDSEDVLFSINRQRGEESKSMAKPFLSKIKEIRSDGKYNVTITLNEGNADFLYVLMFPSLGISPAGTTDFGKGIGTGGYQLVRFEPGVSSLFKRNPNYWKEGRAHFDEVELLCIADTQSRTTALRTGQIDIMNRADRKTANFLEKEPGIQLLNVKGSGHYALPMLTDVPPFNNNDARLALKYAVDREKMLKQILNNYGSVGNDHPIGPVYRYHASELPQREYDPDKARYHFKKAGIEGQTIKLHAADAAYAGAVDTAVLISESARKAGIAIEVVREPDDGYWSNVWMKKAWSFCWWSGKPVEDTMFSMTYAGDAAWNDTNWKHVRFNKLLKEARVELDEKKRKELYVEMQRIVRDEGGQVIPLFYNVLDAANTKVKYGKLSSNYDLDGGRVAERMWFE